MIANVVQCFMFYSTQLLYSRLLADKEDILTMDSFKDNKDYCVLMKHTAKRRYSLRTEEVTRKKSKLGKRSHAKKAVNARKDNMLLNSQQQST